MEYEEKLKELEALLQVRFRDRSLLLRAVTHHSCCPDTAVRDSYDTLEFLGDAIISAHVVEYIYRNYPNASEGEMTALKSEVVSRRILARIGQQIGLFPYIRVDGAIQIDQGPEVARGFVARFILPVVSQLNHLSIDTNPKGKLQKIVLQRSGNLPRYRVLEQSGHTNDRLFTVGVFEHDFLLGMGKASSIKEAGRLAAREALELMSHK